MISNAYLNLEFERAETLLIEGKASSAFERLNLILSQLTPDNPNYSSDSVKVLCALIQAATILEDRDLASLYIERATLLMKEMFSIPSVEKTFMGIRLSELLVSNNNLGQARFFAEGALQCLSECLQECETDEAAETLRRYARIAKKTGELSSAYLALTVGLLAIQDSSGVESLIAADTAELTSLACKAAYPSALSKIGQALLQRAA